MPLPDGGDDEPPWHRRPWVTVAGGMLLLLFSIGAIAFAGGEDDEVASDDRPATRFGSGVKLVNEEIAPGLYVATALVAGSWERLRGVGGRPGDVLARDDASGQAIVEIVATDVAFASTGCGRWELFVAPPSSTDSFGDGDHAVNTEIRPGRYRSDGGSPCSWERSTNFRGEGEGAIIADGRDDGGAVVVIASTDVRFSSSGCGDWRRVS